MARANDEGRAAPEDIPSLGDVAKIAFQAFRRSGGATISLAAGDLAGQRLFAVSVEGRGRRLPGRQLTPERIERYIEANLDLLRSESYCVGIWYDDEDDVTWLDVSETVADEELGRQLARGRGERALFALEDGREIRLLESE